MTTEKTYPADDADADWSQVVAAWPKLDGRARHAVLALARALAEPEEVARLARERPELRFEPEA